MKERGIIMQGESVRGILPDLKTMTRRIVKLRGRHGIESDHNVWRYLETESPSRNPETSDGRYYWQHKADKVRVIHEACPYGQPGDRLWVKETFAHHVQAIGAARDEDGPFVYAADGELAKQYRLGDKWKPSIFMPRYVSRILLEITDIRVERLQDISEADAKAEGVEYDHSEIDFIYWVDDYFGKTRTTESAAACYKLLWESINGAGSWNANPYVWVISFKRIEP